MGSGLPLKAVGSVQEFSSNGVRASFPCPDADRFLDIEDKNLAISYAAGASSFQDCFHGSIDLFGHEYDFDFHLGQKVDDIFCATVQFGVAFLASEPLGLGNRDALNAHLMERLFHLVKFEWLDDRFDFLHWRRIPSRPAGLTGRLDVRN